MSDVTTSVQPARRRSRPVMILAVIVWLFFLLVPCFFITLATQGEIKITLGSVPEHEVRFWLVMEAQQRGIGYSVPIVSGASENAACVQTNVNYFLWMGTSDPTTFCDCFQRPDADAAWELISTEMAACEAR